MLHIAGQTTVLIGLKFFWTLMGYRLKKLNFFFKHFLKFVFNHFLYIYRKKFSMGNAGLI